MKRQASNIRAILKGSSGESLMEGLISIAVFSILIASVTMMLMVSMRITSVSTDAAAERQIEAGAVLTGADLTAVDETIEITVGADIYSVNVEVYSTDNYTAFRPGGNGS